VRPTLGFASWLAVPAETPRWMLASGAPSLASQGSAPSPLELLVGPEGGFSERERSLLVDHGCVPVSLGPRVLRTETAPLAALAAIHALWGDFSGTGPGPV
ncbi:MAG TPA: RsmE family RNA methyltransferase, partial [Usitatibacter sp.]|nr:RsmE family RNA methyltransferase [Usitatibacter sp.]